MIETEHDNCFALVFGNEFATQDFEGFSFYINLFTDNISTSDFETIKTMHENTELIDKVKKIASQLGVNSDSPKIISMALASE